MRSSPVPVGSSAMRWTSANAATENAAIVKAPRTTLPQNDEGDSRTSLSETRNAETMELVSRAVEIEQKERSASQHRRDSRSACDCGSVAHRLRGCWSGRGGAVTARCRSLEKRSPRCRCGGMAARPDRAGPEQCCIRAKERSSLAAPARPREKRFWARVGLLLSQMVSGRVWTLHIPRSPGRLADVCCHARGQLARRDSATTAPRWATGTRLTRAAVDRCRRLYEGCPLVNPSRQIPDTSGDTWPGKRCRVKRLSKVTGVNSHGS
jgi:hypothetical protein